MTLLNTAEVARILRLEVATIRKLLAKGELPGRRIGRDWRVDSATLESYLRTGGSVDGGEDNSGTGDENRPRRMRPVHREKGPGGARKSTEAMRRTMANQQER